MIQNNRGWSLKEMLFIMGILLFFVILVAALINNLYSGLTPSTSSPKVENSKLTYAQVEKNLIDASKRYYNSYSKEVTNLITSEALISAKMIDVSHMTVNKDVCEGYVIINDSNFTPYIKCTNYETKGY